MDRMDPVGMCFTARNNFRQIRAHRPCVESGRIVVLSEQIINSFFFSFSPHSCLNLFIHVWTCSFLSVSKKIGQIRLAHQDMCGTLEILKDENPLERVTRPGTISANFSNIRRVEQVRSCAHMRLVTFSEFGAKNHSQNSHLKIWNPWNLTMKSILW